MATPPRPLVPLVLRLSLALVAVVVAGTIGAASAGAIVTTVGSTQVGLQPRSTTLYTQSEEPLGFANPSGNPVLSANKTYAIYWDPTDHYHGDWQGQIDKFFHNMGAASGSFASVFAVDAQYTDAANQHALYKSTFMGAYTDTDPYPASACEDPEPLEVPDLIGPEVKKHHTPVCLDDTQIQEELGQFITQHSLQKGMGTIFYLMTPPGVTVCLGSGGPSGHCSDYRKASYVLGETQEEREAKEEEERSASEESFCSYHSDISPTSPAVGDANTVLYGVVPWIAGGLGDGDFLTPRDKDAQGYECQDGGWDPSGKKPEKREKKKEQNKEEEEKAAKEFAEMDKEEQENQLEKEFLEGPHQQEPNQQPCPTPDGYCDTGLADLIINQIGVEQQNIVTDPLLDAWQDPKRNEATDECRNFFASGGISGGVTASEETGAGTLSNQLLAGGTYYLNDAFNLAALKLPYPAIPCLPGIRLEPQFTVPNTVNVNEIVGFNGMESDITLNAGTSFTPSDEAKTDYATYTWNFGDGSAPVIGYAPGAPQADSPAVSPCPSWELPCAASTYHTYQYGGTYQVTFTVTDVGGNTVSVIEPIKVEGPPAPAPEQPSNGGSGGGSGAPASTTTGGSSSSSGSSGSASGATSSIPAPVVTGIATTTSLKKALSKGLPVHYTANEQVAGSIEVLLESSVAKRLGVHGSTATGLPKGTPSSIVVGTAVLVTTKAGQGTLHIKFSSRTSARLKHVRKLKLMLRLFARNASRQSPQTTTALSTVVLNP